MLRAVLGSQDQLDLTQTKFDPNNAAHQAELKARIDSFNGAVSALMKSDIIIAVPVTASLLLWMTGNCSIVIELVLLAACAATLWAADRVSLRVAQNKGCQEKLHELLAIYDRCIADHGYQITANENILHLLKTIAPYVETEKLWTVRAANPSDYPVGFKKILSTAPHRVPFGEVKTEAANTLLTTAASLVGLSSSMPVSSQMEIQHHAGGIFNLFRSVAADTRRTIYGYDEKQAASLNKR